MIHQKPVFRCKLFSTSWTAPQSGSSYENDLDIPQQSWSSFVLQDQDMHAKERRALIPLYDMNSFIKLYGQCTHSREMK